MVNLPLLRAIYCTCRYEMELAVTSSSRIAYSLFVVVIFILAPIYLQVTEGVRVSPWGPGQPRGGVAGG